jgi:hypothetical protein
MEWDSLASGLETQSTIRNHAVCSHGDDVGSVGYEQESVKNCESGKWDSPRGCIGNELNKTTAAL